MLSGSPCRLQLTFNLLLGFIAVLDGGVKGLSFILMDLTVGPSFGIMLWPTVRSKVMEL